MRRGTDTLFCLQPPRPYEDHHLTRFLIGTGGWAYFQVPPVHPLVAYSRAFDFVEVNSTFYEMPTHKQVEGWRRLVPSNFEFAVRCNRIVTHKHKFQPTEEAFDVLQRMTTICNILRAEIIHVQAAPRFKPTKTNSDLISDFFSSTTLKGTRIALETRGNSRQLSPEFIKTMQDCNMIHCVDLSKDEKPAYKSDVLYSRLFGQGPHNIYQPTDDELRKVDERASQEDHRTVGVSFHFVRMYKDATRFKIYKQTGGFPMATKSTGLSSLQEVLREDAKFPSSSGELIRHQGWKLIDLTKTQRVNASHVLRKLPEKTYQDVDEVIQTLADMKPR